MQDAFDSPRTVFNELMPTYLKFNKTQNCCCLDYEYKKNSMKTFKGFLLDLDTCLRVKTNYVQHLVRR